MSPLSRACKAPQPLKIQADPIFGPYALINARFANSDAASLKQKATAFFCAGSGGTETYTGKDMVSAHKGMNISEQEFIAVIDDALAALDKNGVGAEERMEVLAILYSMKSQVTRL
ncbi:MAG: group 1 truncated hemoglobin [Acidobacteria bacterium]|nr:group 1 truncated hemoglobin [Acidobacteriota bacterium]